MLTININNDSIDIQQWLDAFNIPAEKIVNKSDHIESIGHAGQNSDIGIGRAEVVMRLSGTGEVRLTFRRQFSNSPTFTSQYVSTTKNSDTNTLKSQRADKLKAGWGLMGKRGSFTRLARVTVQEAATALDNLGIENILMMTLTHPGSTDESIDALERYSSYSVDRINRYLRKALPDAIYLSVWEYQKRNAPHLHYAVMVPAHLRPLLAEDSMRIKWFKTLTAISEKTGVDLFATKDGGTWAKSPSILRVQVEQCKKTTWYLAKLASKSREDIESNHQNRGNHFGPAAWYSISSPLRKLMKLRRHEGKIQVSSPEEAMTLIDHIHQTLRPDRDQVTLLVNPFSHKYSGIIDWVGADRVSATKKIMEDFHKVLENAESDIES